MVFQRRLGDAAKKAISKLQVRTIKKGDKVTASFLFVVAIGQLLKSCLTVCDPVDRSMPGFPVLHCLPDLAQILVQ